MSRNVYVVPGAQGGDSPPHRGSGATPLRIFFPRETCHIFASFFMLPLFLCPLLGDFLAHGFFPMVFYF
jgi:hypothetical protein